MGFIQNDIGRTEIIFIESCKIRLKSYIDMASSNMASCSHRRMIASLDIIFINGLLYDR